MSKFTEPPRNCSATFSRSNSLSRTLLPPLRKGSAIRVGAEMVTMSLPVEPSHRWSLPALQQRRNHFRRNAEPLMLEKLESAPPPPTLDSVDLWELLHLPSSLPDPESRRHTRGLHETLG
ncbi:unnamed protein product [Cladocopium goreaui]|uniref:Uncharacterized protein n=1 Tax=Cladocopium goreaui TaxID=2562237 RepID=A0A9P1DMB0_9DINO|nr:unnamed protein product [Cladocopium goreaui]